MPPTNVVSMKLPHAGLGNMLLVWARATTFATLNEMPVVNPVWGSPHIGPWLRGERCKRFYGSLFSSKVYQSRAKHNLNSLLHRFQVQKNPEIKKLDLGLSSNQLPQYQKFLFDKMPPWNDYFKDLKEHQPIIKEQ